MAITGTENSELLVGTENDDTINGLGGDDTLRGLAGNDALDGGEGADTMEGGQGDDTYRIDDPNDVVIELADEGYDHVDVYTTMVFDFGENIESAYTNRPSTLIGNDGDNYLGGSGGSTLIGGLGNDYYLVAANAAVIEDMDGGIDTVSVTGNYSLPENVENLLNENSSYALGWTYNGNSLDNIMIGYQGPETISGLDGDDQIYADPITGGTAFGSEDQLYGGNGNDILYAVRGNDSLYGEADDDELHSGLGNDLLDGGAGSDTASYVGVTGGVFINLLAADAQDTLSAGIDTLVSIENLVGSAFRDRLVGDDGANRIDAGDGDDRVYGYGGRDVLVLEEGNDRAWGGGQDDRIYGQDGNDRIYG
ncbi:calcium-binding protein, partial [Qipengyuania sphaerica]|uniref:calcium-binding protein n=1 Tax=Qipengyuania sphaerica TaxID=2867243 RepID=UPI001C86AC45